MQAVNLITSREKWCMHSCRLRGQPPHLQSQPLKPVITGFQVPFAFDIIILLGEREREEREIIRVPIEGEASCRGTRGAPEANGLKRSCRWCSV